MHRKLSTDTARRVTLAGFAAATLLALAACQPVSSGPSATPTEGSTPVVPATGTATAAGGGTGTGSGNSGSNSGATPANGGVAACTGSQIKVTTGDGGAGLSHGALTLIFTNISGSTCSLSGYPGAALPDNGVAWNATREMAGYMGGAAGYSSPPTVDLPPGVAASALIEWEAATVNGAPDTAANCPGSVAQSLQVTPPNTQSTSTFPPIQDACQGFEVHPVVPGSTGRSGV